MYVCNFKKNKKKPYTHDMREREKRMTKKSALLHNSNGGIYCVHFGKRERERARESILSSQTITHRLLAKIRIRKNMGKEDTDKNIFRRMKRQPRRILAVKSNKNKKKQTKIKIKKRTKTTFRMMYFYRYLYTLNIESHCDSVSTHINYLPYIYISCCCLLAICLIIFNPVLQHCHISQKSCCCIYFIIFFSLLFFFFVSLLRISASR